MAWWRTGWPHLRSLSPMPSRGERVGVRGREPVDVGIAAASHPVPLPVRR